MKITELAGRKRKMTGITNILQRVGFSPSGFILLVVLAVLPFIPPFSSEFILRWLIFVIPVIFLFRPASSVMVPFSLHRQSPLI